MKKFSSFVNVSLKGLNFEKLINFLVNNHINLINLNKSDYNQMSFTLSLKDYNKTKKLNAFASYDAKIDKNYSILNFIKNLKVYGGLMLGICVCLPMFMFFNMFTYDIKVLGLSRLNKDQIVSYLATQNIETGKINKATNQNIETILKEKFKDISLVSVIKKGTNIIINIKEKDKVDKNNANEIVAKDNLRIISIEVNQGTQIKNVGDIVKAGDPIVLPYIINEDNETISVVPIARIEAEVWYFGVKEFKTVEENKVNTGKKIVNSVITFKGKEIIKSSKENTFKDFKEEVSEINLFPNFFLPIKIKKQTFYEQKVVVKKHDFEKNKEKIIKESKKLAYEVKPKSQEVLEELLNISIRGTTVIVQTSLKVNVSYEING